MFSAFQTFGRLGAGGLPFSERALWPQDASSPGLWIDPSYSASQWQDSAGTTPLSAVGTVLDSSNPVGLVLDRKGGLQLGSELIDQDSDFALSGAPSSWVVSNNGTSLTVASVLGTHFAVVKPNGVSPSGWIRMTFTVTSGIAYLYSTNLGVYIALGIGVGSYSYAIPDNGMDVSFVSLAECQIDNISVREIPGLHLQMATSPSRPVASARKNLLVATATLSTQSVTVTAIPHTITFSGGGTVTASGTYSGALTNGQTFTPTAGTLTLTVSGSVTSAQLESGSAATTYQAVVSASDYTATGFPLYTKFDGTDDALASATFSAGTLTSSMDCLIAVRRDSAAMAIVGPYQAAGDATKFIGVAESGSPYLCVGIGAGAPTVFVDGTQLTGGTAVTPGTLHTALTPGAWHIVEFRGLNLSTWTALALGAYGSGYNLNGALGEIQLFASGQDANRDKARARMAAYFGVTLP